MELNPRLPEEGVTNETPATEVVGTKTAEANRNLPALKAKATNTEEPMAALDQDTLGLLELLRKTGYTKKQLRKLMDEHKIAGGPAKPRKKNLELGRKRMTVFLKSYKVVDDYPQLLENMLAVLAEWAREHDLKIPQLNTNN